MGMYENNLEFLKVHLITLYEDIRSEQCKYNSLISNTEEKQNLLVENEGKKCFIHSIYDKKREAEMMFRDIDKNTKNLLIFGFGYGYALDYIINNFKKLEKVIIIEPDLNLFLKLLNFIDLQEILIKLKSVTFIINKTFNESTNIIWDSLSAKVKDGVSIVYNISYRTLYFGYFEATMKKWGEYLNETTVNIATNDLFLYTWPINTFKNIKEIALPIEELVNKFEDLPAILVSAGPSLNKNMHYLKEIRNKCVIVAVGSAIKILDSNGIIPHYRFAFDGSEGQDIIFKNIDTESSVLVFGDELNTKVLPAYKGKKIRMVLDTSYLIQYIQGNDNKSSITIKSGFSIANVALDALIKLGFKKIIFMGQDLCYTKGNLYAKGSWKSEEIDTSKKEYIETKNVFNEVVYTDKAFMGMKSLIEKSIDNNSKTEYINATEGGLNIEGTKVKTFKDVMREDLLKVYDVEKITNDIYNKYDFSKNCNKRYEAIINIYSDINEMLIENDKRIKLLKKISKYKEREMGINRLISELDYCKVFEVNLKKYSFYKNSVERSLNSKFTAINANFYYEGSNKVEEFNSKFNIEIGKAQELEKYLKFLKTLIEEFKNSYV